MCLLQKTFGGDYLLELAAGSRALKTPAVRRLVTAGKAIQISSSRGAMAITNSWPIAEKMEQVRMDQGETRRSAEFQRRLCDNVLDGHSIGCQDRREQGGTELHQLEDMCDPMDGIDVMAEALEATP